MEKWLNVEICVHAMPTDTDCRIWGYEHQEWRSGRQVKRKLYSRRVENIFAQME